MNKKSIEFGKVLRFVGITSFCGLGLYTLVRKAVGDAMTKDLETKSGWHSAANHIEFVYKN